MNTARLGPAARTTGPARSRRRHQTLLVWPASLLLVVAVASAGIYLTRPGGDTAAMLASFVAYGTVPAVLSLALLALTLLRSRRRRLVVAGLALALASTVVHLVAVGPAFVPDDRPGRTEPLSVVSLNLEHGTADLAQVWDVARTADVVVLLEYDGFDVDLVAGNGWRTRFPYSAGDVPGDFSTAIFSRYPVSDTTELPRSKISRQWMTTVDSPQLGRVRVVAAHPCNPLCGGGRWSLEHAALASAVAPYADEQIIVAGDFNAVDEHPPMRRLRQAGFRSATDILGAGWLPTYPADSPHGLPVLLPIDHVLVSDVLTATSIATFRVDGTDHLGLVATVAGAR